MEQTSSAQETTGALSSDLLKGELVRLCSDDPETIAKAFARWDQNSEYSRLLDTESVQVWSEKKIKEWVEKDQDQDGEKFISFMIHTVQDDRLIGIISLWGFQWTHGEAGVAIGLGDPDTWGKGYGTEAMRLVLRYAFDELNLHRVFLWVFAYNERAIRSYEKTGFKREGCIRECIRRNGRRWDMYVMGILREEWQARS
jgi:RimJ/RimL family protein N-acetyltransferase